MQIELQPAYVLHTRAYRDTSMLVDFITPHYGRFTAVARGVRSRKTIKRNLLNPFTYLLISFQGKSDLKLLTSFESSGKNFSLTERHLFSGFYLNELLMRLLPAMDAHLDIFSLYEASLQALHESQEIEIVLRKFELRLLAELGYEINFQADARSGFAIEADKFYSLDAQRGFARVDYPTPMHDHISGQHILAIAEQDYGEMGTRQAAKRITRLLLQPLLGKKPLASRELFK